MNWEREEGAPFKFGFGAETKTETSPTAETILNLRGAEEIEFKAPGEVAFEILRISSDTTIKKVKPDASSDQSTPRNAFDVAVLNSDVVPGLYEGGMKLWECCYDLLEYLNRSYVDPLPSSFSVLELGCGHGLPGVYMAGKNATVHLQDYNSEVIRTVTIPNCALNNVHARFFAGDWSLLNDYLTDSYDLLLLSETIYYPSSYRKLAALLAKHMKPAGHALVAAKSYYFGTGGGSQAFKHFLEDEYGGFRVESLQIYNDGASSLRELLKVSLI